MSEQNQNKLLNYFSYFLFAWVVILPFLFDKKYNYDVLQYQHLLVEIQHQSWSFSFLNNTFILKVFGFLFSNFSSEFTILLIFYISIFTLFIAIKKKLRPMAVVSLLLFLSYSVFSGQFREALAIAICSLLLKKQMNGNCNYIESIITILLSGLVHFFTAVFFSVLLLIYHLIKDKKNIKLLTLCLIAVLVVLGGVFFLNGRYSFYFKSMEMLALMFFVTLFIFIINLKFIYGFKFFFSATLLGSLILISNYHFSTRISEIGIFAIIYISDLRKKQLFQNRYIFSDMIMLIGALIFYVYKTVNIFLLQHNPFYYFPILRNYNFLSV